MKHILLATDFSNAANKAVDYAINCFEGYPVTYHLVYVSECKSNLNNSNGIATPCYGTACGLKRKLLSSTAKNINARLDSKLQQCVAYHKNLPKVEALRKHAQEHQIDLIVIGSKGTTNNGKVVLGAFARDIITRVQCPFLIVPELAQMRTPKNMLFPTNYNNIYHNASLSTLADFQAIGPMNLDVLYFTRQKRQLDSTQIENKALLEDFLEGSSHESHAVQDTNLEKAIQEHIIENPADLLILMAKNRSFCERLLQRDSKVQRELINQMPVLLLHE